MDRMPTDVPPLPALIALYLVNCRVEGKSPRTLKAYGWTLARFQRALQEDGAPQDVRALGPAQVIAYLERSTHLARETRHRYFREVRCFFAWCERTGFVGTVDRLALSGRTDRDCGETAVKLRWITGIRDIANSAFREPDYAWVSAFSHFRRPG